MGSNRRLLRRHHQTLGHAKREKAMDSLHRSQRSLSLLLDRHIKLWQTTSLPAFAAEISFTNARPRHTARELVKGKASRTLRSLKLYISGKEHEFIDLHLTFVDLGTSQPRVLVDALGDDNGKPQPISHLLDRQLWTMFDHSTNLASKHLRWWLTNGKAFPLLALPSELRNIIYEVNAPETCSSDMKLSERLDGGLLLANRQISVEYKAIIARYTHFVFNNQDKLGRVLANPDSSWVFSLRSVELDIDDICFPPLMGHLALLIDMLGSPILRAREALMHRSKGGREIFGHLHKLRLARLVLRFSHTSQSQSKASRHVSWLWCTTFWVVKFLMSSWDLLAGLPIVLEGYIRKPIKDVFEPAFAQAHRRRCKIERIRDQLGLTKGVGDDLNDNDQAGGVSLGWLATDDVPAPVEAPQFEEPWYIQANKAPLGGCMCPQNCDDMQSWGDAGIRQPSLRRPS